MNTDQLLAKALHDKKSSGEYDEIVPINNTSLIYYNSVNLAIGKQGSGKSLLFLREILKIQNTKGIHLLVYVTPDGTIQDRTFLAVQPLLTIPVLVVKTEDAEEVVQGIVNLKHQYNLLVESGRLDKLVPDQQQEILELLHLKEFPRGAHQSRLHTILFFDDVAFSSLFVKDDSYFNKFVTRCRHTNFIVMFAAQKMAKAVSVPVKSQVTSLMIYPGFSWRELSNIFYNTTIKGGDYHGFKNLYGMIKKDQVLYANSKDDLLKIIDLSHLRLEPKAVTPRESPQEDSDDEYC